MYEIVIYLIKGDQQIYYTDLCVCVCVCGKYVCFDVCSRSHFVQSGGRLKS
jgi:hypothetical protein